MNPYEDKAHDKYLQDLRREQLRQEDFSGDELPDYPVAYSDEGEDA